MNKRLFLGVLILLAVLAVVEPLSMSGPNWNPSTAFTNDTLNCSWTYSLSDTLAQNITFYNGSAIYNITYENATLQNLSTSMIIPSSLTHKADQWKCRIQLVNETTTIAFNKSLTISNSPPSTEDEGAGVFNDTGEDVGFLVQILEDTTLNIDVNATDADDDTLTYQNADEFCTRQSSSLGTYTCSPTQSDLSGNQATLYNISFSATDGQNLAGRTILFNVTPVNDAPNATVSNQETSVNLSLNVTFTASDEETNYPLNLSLIFNTSNDEIENKMSIAFLNADGTSFSVYYDATNREFSDVGVWPIYVSVTDNESLSTIVTYDFNITSVGQEPYFTNIATTGPYYIQQGEFIQINISANDPDANSTLDFFVNTARFNITRLKADTNTSDAEGQINFTPTNDDVAAFNVTITIIDLENLENTTTLEFIVSNVNDSPEIHEMSFSASNTLSNQNASNLTGYASAPFVYDVNATDIDDIHGDTLNYTDNTTLFNISWDTGRINFTPGPGDVQVSPYHILITATDDNGTQATRTIYLTINGNSPPYFNMTLNQMNCTTDADCSRFLGGYADDANDAVDSYDIVFTSGNLSTFSYNTSTGLINFTPDKTAVGNYTVNVTITDTFGASNSSLMNIVVNNTPVSPILTRYDFSGSTLVETFLFTYDLYANDSDYLVTSANENVTFTTNLSVSHVITPLTTTGSETRARLSFTPSLGEAGNYTIQINATDAFGLVDTELITFEIFAKVPPPNITQVTPWGSSSLDAIQTSYSNVSFLSNPEPVNLSENTMVFFDVNVTSTRLLTYNWTLNGTQVGTGENYTKLFDFFSAGTYTVSVNVSDDRLQHTIWSWDLVVMNVNRAPVLSGALVTPLEINTSHTYSTYFTVNNGTKFYDPDDDLDSNAEIDGNESNTLTFSSVGSCAVASVSITNSDLTLTPISIGTCNVQFNATDEEGLTLESGTVIINVTGVPEGEVVIETPSSSSGGGSSSTSRFIPLKQDDEPKAFHLIAPRLVTVYQNNSITIPVVVNNTWTEALELVQLSVETNVSGITAELDTDLFEEIPMNESREVLLTVTNYRLGENYEVVVRGNVSEPSYEDEALILLNSLEQASQGNDVQVKVTFANDLINEHPECQELNEVLDEAKTKLSENNFEGARDLVESVINGCKYLVSMQQRIDERPSKINPVITINNISMKTIMWSLLAFVLFASIALLAYYHYSYKPEEDI